MGEGDRKHLVGFDLGGTKMMAVVFDPDFKPVGRARRKTKGQEGSKAGLERIAETIKMAIEEAKIGAADIAGIGVAVPGPLDLDKGVILEMPNLGWKDVHLKHHLQKSFECGVAVANDVDCGVYGEYRFGAAKGARCAVGIFPGTGIGGGCVYEGKLLRGRTNSCLEIGHCQVVPDGPRCGCGRRGCLEAVASRLAISSAIAAAVYRGEAPCMEKLAGSDVAGIRSSMIAEAIKGGDKVVEEIVRDAARWIGVGISIAVNLLAPDIVVLGGGLVEALPDIFLKESEKAARNSVMPSFRDLFKVVTAKLGDDACAFGAAALAGDSYGRKNGDGAKKD